MAGNPDQQEDTLDDQYQEEVEDEVCNSSDALETNMQSMSPVDPLCVWLFCLVIAVLKAQEDIAGGQKREEEEVEEEDPYNEENIEQVGSCGGNQSQRNSLFQQLNLIYLPSRCRAFLQLYIWICSCPSF